ncbi:MAG: hypothetical protein ACU85V_11290 [Gammaproteobacteria bacterium]
MMRTGLPGGLAVLLLVTSAVASAESIVIRQTWLSTNFASNGRLAKTTSVVPAANVTGVGIENVLLSAFSMAVEMNGIGQNFNLADLPDEPSLTEEGNAFAVFLDGAFQRLGQVNNGGNPAVPLVNGNPPFNAAGAFLVGTGSLGEELIWGYPVSGSEEFLLDAAATTVTFPAAIPLPGALVLLLAGLGALLPAALRRS